MEPKEIVDKLGAFVEKDPGDPRFARVGDAFLKMGDFKNALAVLTKGVKLNPRYFTGQLILAHTLRQAGYLPQAKERYKIVLRLDPANIAAMWQLSAVSFEEDNEADGIRYLKKILLVNPYHQLAQEELKRRTGKEYGPPRPPQPKREAQLPIPSRQDGPIVIDSESEQEEADIEKPQSVVSDSEDVPVTESSVETGIPASAEAQPHKPESEPAGDDFEELFEMDISEMEIVAEDTSSKAPVEESSSADGSRTPKGITENAVNPVITEEESPEEYASHSSEIPSAGASSAQSEQTPPPEKGDSDGSILGGGALEISEDALFFEEEKEPSEEPKDEAEEVLAEKALAEEHPNVDTQLPQEEESPRPASADEKVEETVTFDRVEFEKESSVEKVEEEEIPDFEERIPQVPAENEINVSSPEELARLLGASADDDVSESSEIPTETGETDMTDTLEDAGAEEASSEEIESSQMPSDEEIEDIPDFGRLADEDNESIVFAEEESPEEELAKEAVMTEDAEEIDKPVDAVLEIDNSEDIDFGSFGGDEKKINDDTVSVEEDEEPIAIEQPEEDIPEGEIEEAQISPEDDSEAIDTEDIDGLLTSGGFEPPEEVSDEVEGLEVSGGFEPPEEEIAIEDILTREDFMGQDDDIEPEFIEGIIQSEGFEPEINSEEQSDDLEDTEPEETDEAEVYTVTMAEIYSAQGQIEKALWIYGKILEAAEEDEEISRITQRMDYLKGILAEKGE